MIDREAIERELPPVPSKDWADIRAWAVDAIVADRERLRRLVDEQAEDEDLWFNAVMASESYLQQELRRLHAAIEGAQAEQGSKQ